ncbi:MAG TPA: thioredoxin domain-containing protein [Gammaproteobacteria bacterium]|nr:thioredoxin domain-containing protein [Gammaproteobacteria bacterium]
MAISVVTNLILVARLYLPRWRQAWIEYRTAPPVERPGDHVRGAGAVTVIEYSDFQCPYCASLNHTLASLADSGQMRWVYRHYTGNTGHPQSMNAAEAAECAGEQGRFWQYADALTIAQPHLAPALYPGIAAKLHLDPSRFRACLAAGKFKKVIARDAGESETLAIMGTPTWFVNGKRHVGAPAADVVQDVIAKARAAAANRP